MASPAPQGLFTVFGIEIEYMLVDRVSLRVMPVADRLMSAASGTFDNEIARGPLAWSNELAAHVIEMKTNGPVASLATPGADFRESIRAANALLEKEGARLLGTGMHPFMDPRTETRLWPHGYHEIYEAFDRLFDCRRHGWANLQSIHLNLPFANDAEFGRLHAAVRLVLPLVPALAAASPIVGGRITGWADTRLETYRSNSLRVPSITGEVIPEALFTMDEYREKILGRIYRDLAPLDPEGILCEEWVNARGAIARFERSAIEIRLIDAQETPAADVAVAAAVAGAVQLFTDERFAGIARQKAWRVEPLAAILRDTIREGGDAIIRNTDYLALFGITGGPLSARGLWGHLLERVDRYDRAVLAPHSKVLGEILGRGTLASRIIDALGNDPSPERVLAVYRRIADCLESGNLFIPD